MYVECRYKKCIRNAVFFILSFYLLKKERKTDDKQKMIDGHRQIHMRIYRGQNPPPPPWKIKIR